MNIKIQFSVLLCLLLISLSSKGEKFHQTSVLPGEIHLEATAIHPFFRTEAFPSNMEVDSNPVVFFWPSTRIEHTDPLLTYDFQLSNDSKFTSLWEESKSMNPSFYVSKKRLPEGVWFWRFRESSKTWSPTYSFTVGASTLLDQRPSAQTFVDNVNGVRPRVVIRRERLESTRLLFKKEGVTDAVLKETEKYFEVVLPESEWGGKFYKNGQRVFTQKKFPDDHIKAKITSPIWNGAVVSMCRAYLLTGEKKYAEEALRWGMKVLSFKPMPTPLSYEGNPYPDGFDFSFYTDAMTHLYDALYDYMTPEQRNEVLKNLSERLEIFYRYYCNRLESRCIDNHSWQISIGSFLKAAIVVKGDLPGAEKYLRYAYDIWKARDPEQSHTDGGWFGGGYFSVNIGVWSEVPIYFRNFTGYNFYNYPFYQNQPYWILYRQAPGSKEDGFSGDNYGDDATDYSPTLKMWMNVLDADLDIPVAGWIGRGAKENRKGETFAWARRVEGLPMQRDRSALSIPDNLPQARAFRDVGVVNMHTDLMHPENDLHVAFRSSPYGTFGHNLASHNAFNVIYRGDYLFVPFGYRFGGAKNSVACYRHTRGHNSILVDGKGQPFSPDAYGWIARFLHGKQITYSCGDASNAYDADSFGREDDFFERAGLKMEDHVSRGKVTRFRRHVLFLRSSLIVIYDELEAKEPVRWDWVLHCRKMMTASGMTLGVEGGQALVSLYATIPMSSEVKTQPMFMPINVDGRGGQAAGEPYPVKGCYANLSTTHKVDKQRIVAFIQVGEVKPIKSFGEGMFRCGDWQIQSELNPAKIANLIVSGPDGASFLMKTADSGESVLREKIGGKIVESRVVDELPYDARGLKHVSNIHLSK